MARALRSTTMTVDEFLVWDDGTDTRYELEDGVAVAMAPALSPHARIAQNVGSEIDRQVADRPPCRALQAAGVLISRPRRKFYIPDVVMTCEPPHREVEVREPRLVVEILSPSTRGVDQRRKVPAYTRLPPVEEVWLVDGAARRVTVWRRSGEGWAEPAEYEGSDAFASPTLRGEVALDRLYHLSGVDDP